MNNRQPWLFLASLALLACCATAQDSNSLQCQSTKLVVYKVTFTTFWDREKFPRQYPEWRPPAQWSKLVGFSHSPDYHLFRLGERASSAVQEFAEKASTEALDKQKTQNGAAGTSRSANDHFVVFDGFNAPPIEPGTGTSQASLFLDGNHTRVSLMSKMVPSPDWFVGLDSLNLCENGHFVDSVTVEADPLDAGTDNGFTFTSPNWPTTPQGVIFRITNNYPPHPASSFHYPEKASLPTIATFTFVKEKEYELSEVFHMRRNEASRSVLPMTQVNKYAYQVDNNRLDNSIVTFVPSDSEEEGDKRRRLEKQPVAERRISNEIPIQEKAQQAQSTETNNVVTKPVKLRHHHHGTIKSFRRGYHASTGPNDFLKKKYSSEYLKGATDKVYNKDDDFYSKILQTYDSRRKAGLSKDLSKKLKRRRMRRLRHRRKKTRGPRNCKLSEWSQWSPCSKTCGIGESSRTRKVLRHPKRGGKPCPALSAMRWCGSARNCHGKYFDW